MSGFLCVLPRRGKWVVIEEGALFEDAMLSVTSMKIAIRYALNAWADGNYYGIDVARNLYSDERYYRQLKFPSMRVLWERYT